MKKLLSILLLYFCFSATAQTMCDFNCDESIPVTDNNMSVVFPQPSLIDYAGSLLYAFVSLNGSSIVPVSDGNVIAQDGSAGVPVIGSDYYYDLADPGEEILFAILMNNETVVILDVYPSITYYPNEFIIIGSNNEYIDFTVEGNPVEFGCTDDYYLEYSPSANIDNGSCEVLIIYGCTDSQACNYYSEANFDDWSCIYAQQYYDCENVCVEDADLDGVCDELEIPGCQDPIYLEYNPFATEDDFSCNTLVVYGCSYTFALNFNSLANVNDGSCLVEGCTYDWADNFDDLATENDGSCYKYECTEDWADNFDDLATENDGSCYKYGCISEWADNFDEYATIDDESCFRYGCTSSLAVNYDEYATIDSDNCDFDIITYLNMSFDAWNVSINLQEGWNMIGYGCPSTLDVIDALSSYTEQVIIIKDNNGLIYMPEYGFNGIGDFTPGFGYQIKLTEAIESFSLCDWYVNDIPEDNIVSLQEEVENLQSELDSFYGCIDETACNFHETAFINDENCNYGEPGFNCDGSQLQIGDFHRGGIVFYLDSTGEHGLVAAKENLPGTYQWGCNGTSILGADGQAIGTGLQNTLDIVAGCSETPIAASEALAYESEGYSDWYLPSRDELNEMYYEIGQGSPEGNIGDFINGWYWSSSEGNSQNAWAVGFGNICDECDGFVGIDFVSNANRVRVIRSF